MKTENNIIFFLSGEVILLYDHNIIYILIIDAKVFYLDM